jgi:hypothetical protein
MFQQLVPAYLIGRRQVEIMIHKKSKMFQHNASPSQVLSAVIILKPLSPKME